MSEAARKVHGEVHMRAGTDTDYPWAPAEIIGKLSRGFVFKDNGIGPNYRSLTPNEAGYLAEAAATFAIQLERGRQSQPESLDETFKPIAGEEK